MMARSGEKVKRGRTAKRRWSPESGAGSREEENLELRKSGGGGEVSGTPSGDVRVSDTALRVGETSAPVLEDRRYWPRGKRMPRVIKKRRRELVPCPNCRRVLLDDMGQAVVCTSSGDDVAWFRCRACEHRFKLGVEVE